MKYRLMVCVEREDGSTFVQEIEALKFENSDKVDVRKSLGEYRKVLGRGYMICDWWLENDK